MIDVDARITAQRFEVPVSGTIGVLIYFIHRKHITLEEGNRMLKSMINKGYYSPIRILDDLLDT
jgi:predicted nucleic acid-binding protein